MRNLIFIGVLFMLPVSASAQTQPEMNKAEHTKYLKADKELNTIYQEILKEYKSDLVFIKSLKAAQVVWIKFRDAEMKLKYPDREAGYYGSIHPMCWSVYKNELTQERTAKLKQWVTGEEEGNSCTSSIKVKK